jgi:soluble lytic murein transglycosylase-like protein
MQERHAHLPASRPLPWPATRRRRWAGGRAAATAVAAAAAALALGVDGPADADIWSYTDAEGVVHFTNVPPGAAAKKGWKLFMRETAKPASDAPRAFDAAVARYDDVLAEAGARYAIPRALLKAIVLVESNFDPGAVSSKGAEGLMQLMPGTAADMGVGDSFDPRENLLGGARYLRVLANRFGGDLVLTVAAYNAGPDAVAKSGPGIPPYTETRAYVTRVLRFYYHYKSLGL